MYNPGESAPGACMVGRCVRNKAGWIIEACETLVARAGKPLLGTHVQDLVVLSAAEYHECQDAVYRYGTMARAGALIRHASGEMVAVERIEGEVVDGNVHLAFYFSDRDSPKTAVYGTFGVETTIKPPQNAPMPVPQDVVRKSSSSTSHSAQLEKWYAELQARGVVSAKYKMQRVRNVLKDIEGEPTTEAIYQWFLDARSRERPIGPAHIDNIRRDLSLYFDWLGEGPDIKRIPKIGSSREIGEGVGAFMPEEMAAIIRAADLDEAREKPRRGWKRAALYLLCWETATRVGQARRAKTTDFDLSRRVYFRRAETAKTGKPSICPISADLCRRLEPLLGDAAPYVFAQVRDPSKPTTAKRDNLLADMSDAGVPWVGRDGLTRSWNSIRKGAASVMAENGVSPHVAKAVFGHANFATTAKHYTRIRPEAPREVVDAILDLSEKILDSEPDSTEDPVSSGNGDSSMDLPTISTRRHGSPPSSAATELAGPRNAKDGPSGGVSRVQQSSNQDFECATAALLRAVAALLEARR
ncbi:MAG: hypothetical protein B7733_13150 [Myxococcales bacterium FL481]|nr:MAG: hypothetical protein B7733_13150 [Myxococcales bacterium FL481]